MTLRTCYGALQIVVLLLLFIKVILQAGQPCYRPTNGIKLPNGAILRTAELQCATVMTVFIVTPCS